MIRKVSHIFDNDYRAVKIDQEYDQIKIMIAEMKSDFLIDVIRAIIYDIKIKHEIYEKTKFYLVGGINRDKFLNIDSKDLDIVITKLKNVPDEEYFFEFKNFMDLFSLYGDVSNNNPNKDNKSEASKFITYKFIPNIIDKNCKNITSYIFKEQKFEPIDIVAARIEKTTGLAGYHESFIPVYSYNLDIKDDLLRRDYLINAIAKDLETDEFVFPYDYTLDTIKNQFDEKILSAVNLANLVIDPTRMLRGIQLCGKLNFDFDNDTYSIIKKYYHLIQFSKKERVEQELLKMCKKSINLKKAIIYFVHSGLYLYLFGMAQSTHINISHIIENLDIPPSNERKNSIDIIDWKNIFKTDLFTTIFENDKLYQFSKDNMFEIVLGLLCFIAMTEHDINKDTILLTIKNNITNNLDYILFIGFIIDLSQIIFNSDTNKEKKMDNFNTFISLIYNNSKLRNSLSIFLRLIEIYNNKFYNDIEHYTNDIYKIVSGNEESEIINVDSKIVQLKDICIYIGSTNIFLNKGEIHKSTKKTIFMYDKYVYHQKRIISKNRLDECKKNKLLEEEIKKISDEIINTINENSILQIIHNTVTKTLTKMCPDV